MLQTRVIPCLLLKGQGLVKTTKFKDPKYVGDPINAVKIFNEKEVDELIFLDITATVENRGPNFDLIKDIATECFMPLGYGGGIKTFDDAKKLFLLGVEKIILNSYATSPGLITKIASVFGSQSIVVSVDIKKSFLGKYEVFTHGGRVAVKTKLWEYIKTIEDFGAGEIFLNSIDRDGTQLGYDLALIKQVADIVKIPVIACGGAGKIDDFRLAVFEGGASAVSAGSMFVFYGKHKAVLITYPSIAEIENIF